MQQSTREAGKTSTAETTFLLGIVFDFVSELAEGKALDQINSMRTSLDPNRLHSVQL